MYVRIARGLAMGSRRRLLAPVIAVTLTAGVSLGLNAQTPLQTSDTVRRLVLPATGTTGLSGSYWRTALGNGGPMPGFERLLVVGNDGAILGEANGDEDHVLLPEPLFRMLSDGTVHATLVHNHPGGVSLSGTDLSQLGKAGVERVIAVSPDGSVFEASAGSKFDAKAFDGLYARLLKDVTERVNREALRDGVELARVYPNICHLVALALDRSGVIRYRMTPSLKLRIELDRYRHVLEWTVDSGKNR
jgi:hypothetical protein